MGIRKKITLGFSILAILLLFSGTVSLLELRALNLRSREIIRTGSANAALAKQMLDALQVQNMAVLEKFMSGQTGADSTFTVARKAFDAAIELATQQNPSRSVVDAIKSAQGNYYELLLAFFINRSVTDREWFMEMYKEAFSHLYEAVTEYMADSNNLILDRAASLEDNAYRAISPGIIALIAALMITLMFSFLLDAYYTRPLVRIGKSLDGWIKHKIPFNADIHTRDEIAGIRDKIQTLIAICVNRKA